MSDIGEGVSSARTERWEVGGPWRLLAMALVWIVVAFIGAAVLSVVAGLAVGAIGGPSAVAKQSARVFFGLTGVTGASLTCLLIARGQAKVVGNGNRAAGLGDGPVHRRLIVAFLAIGAGAYGSLLAIAVYRAQPDIPGSDFGLPLFLLSALVFVGVAPVGEELFFRGWLWTGLRKHWGAIPTALVTGTLWLVVHVEGGLLKPLLLLPVAAILAAARHYGSSVRAPIMMHALSNFVTVVAPALLSKVGMV